MAVGKWSNRPLRTPREPLSPSALSFDKPLCAALDGFTLHAATRAGALDTAGREALLRYVLRPPLAQDRLETRPDGLVRIALKKPFSDGTVAVDLDPLSLLCRLAASVPPPRFHTVKYAGVLAPASAWQARIAPRVKAAPEETAAVLAQYGARPKGGVVRNCRPLVRGSRLFGDVCPRPENRGRNARRCLRRTAAAGEAQVQGQTLSPFLAAE